MDESIEIARWADGSRLVRPAGPGPDAGDRPRWDPEPGSDLFLLDPEGIPIWTARIRPSGIHQARLWTNFGWWSRSALIPHDAVPIFSFEEVIAARGKITGLVRALGSVLDSRSVADLLEHSLCPLGPYAIAGALGVEALLDLEHYVGQLEQKFRRLEPGGVVIAISFTEREGRPSEIPKSWVSLCCTGWCMMYQLSTEIQMKQGVWLEASWSPGGWAVESRVRDGQSARVVDHPSLLDALEELGIAIRDPVAADAWFEQSAEIPELAPDVEACLLLGVVPPVLRVGLPALD